MKHSSVVPDFDGSHEQLAEQVGDLFYDSLAELLGLMADKIRRDAEADRLRDRTKLAQELTTCAEHLSAASKSISQAWEICEPFMAQAVRERDGA